MLVSTVPTSQAWARAMARRILPPLSASSCGIARGRTMIAPTMKHPGEPRDQGRGEVGVAGEEVGRLEQPEDDQRPAADGAGDEEEDGRAAGGEGAGDAGADQDHGAEREAAAAAAGQEDVGALLDHADVEGLAPAEAALEGAAQGDDEAQHREQLQDEGGDDPAGLGVGEAIADRLEEGDPDDGGGSEHDEACREHPVDEDRATFGRLLARRLDLLGAVQAAPAELRAGVVFLLRGGLYELQQA